MVKRSPQHSEETPVPQRAEQGKRDANKIGASTPFDCSETSNSRRCLPPGQVFGSVRQVRSHHD